MSGFSIQQHHFQKMTEYMNSNATAQGGRLYLSTDSPRDGKLSISEKLLKETVDLEVALTSQTPFNIPRHNRLLNLCRFLRND
jgi:hypothetical protein